VTMRNTAYIVVALIGLGMLVMGAILPTRLPMSERNIGMETVYSVVGVGLAVLPIVLERRRVRKK
jgi:hypothetical protein